MAIMRAYYVGVGCLSTASHSLVYISVLGKPPISLPNLLDEGACAPDSLVRRCGFPGKKGAFHHLDDDAGLEAAMVELKANLDHMTGSDGD